MYSSLKNKQFEFVLIYLCLLFFSGYYFFEYWTLPGIIIIAGLLMLRIKCKNIIQKIVGYIFLSMMFNILFTECITSIVYSDYSSSMLMIGLSIVNVVLAFIFSLVMDYRSFKESFINCMIVIAGISLLTYVLYQVIPSIITKFPTFINSLGRVGYFMIFSIVSDFSSAGAQRNQGIFWEPGVFQVFLNLAYIFELSSEKHKPRKWVLVLFLISVVTTYSTTGIIVATVLFTFTLSRHKGTTNVIKTILIVCVIGAVICYIIPRLTGFWQYTLVRKIEMLINYQNVTVNDVSSRMDSVVYPFIAFLKSPLWGIGNSGYTKLAKEVGHSMFTFSPINWFAKYGIFYGMLVLVGIWKFFKNSFKNPFETIIVFVLFLLSISSEALQSNIIIIAMCFWGYTRILSHPKYSDETIKNQVI